DCGVVSFGRGTEELFVQVAQSVLDRLLCRVLTVQSLDHVVGWSLSSEVGVVAITQKELTAGCGMRADAPAAGLMTVVLLDELIDAGTDRAEDAELGEIGTEPGPESVVRA